MKKTIFVIIFFMSTNAFAGIDSATISGSTLELRGSGFGTKSPAAPLIYDNVENGSRSTDWTTLDAGIAVDSSAINHTGSNYCYVMDNALATAHNVIIEHEITSQLYVYVKRRYDYDITYDNHKFMRVWQSDVADGYVRNSLVWNYQDGYDNPKYHMRGGEGTLVDPSNPTPLIYILLSLDMWPQIGQWQTDEFFIKLETGIGNYDGVMGYRLNNNEHRSWAANRGMFDANHNYPFTEIVIDNFAGDRVLSGTKLEYYDDMYVDTTWQRVVLGNNSDYDSCTIIEIQPATSWSASAIDTTLILGDLTGESTVWAFIIDDTNTIVASSAIVLSEPTAPTVTINTVTSPTTAATQVITGTATATTGRTITGVTIPGQTVTPVDGTWDEISEDWTCTYNLSLGTNSIVATGTDDQTETGTASAEIIRNELPAAGGTTTVSATGTHMSVGTGTHVTIGS